MKSCENCFFSGISKEMCYMDHDMSQGEKCVDYRPECDECRGLAKWRVEERSLCDECTLENFSVVKIVSAKYWLDGDLGTSDDMDDVMKNLRSAVEGIKELE